MRRFSILFISLAGILLIGACSMRYAYKGQTYDTPEEVYDLLYKDMGTIASGITPSMNPVGGKLIYYRQTNDWMREQHTKIYKNKGLSPNIPHIDYNTRSINILDEAVMMYLRKSALFDEVSFAYSLENNEPSLNGADYIIWHELEGTVYQRFMRSKFSQRKFRLVGKTTEKDPILSTKYWLEEVEKWARVAKVQ